MRRKIFDHQSVYQSSAIPIPRFLKNKRPYAYNFTGRVINQLISKTHYTETIYADFKQAWSVLLTYPVEWLLHCRF